MLICLRSEDGSHQRIQKNGWFQGEPGTSRAGERGGHFHGRGEVVIAKDPEAGSKGVSLHWPDWNNVNIKK